MITGGAPGNFNSNLGMRNRGDDFTQNPGNDIGLFKYVHISVG